MTTTNHEHDDNPEKHEFQPEIMKMLAVSKSLFTKNSNEHCLQELISTAAESIDRLRYQLFEENQESELDADHFIRLIPDTLSNTLTIWDSGIGMTKQDLLSCFCYSPWVVPRQYMESLNNGEEVSVDRQLGLFSSFLVAHKVVIYTKHKDDKQYVCEATGDSFTIRLDNGPSNINRGTCIVLHLLQNQHENSLDAGKLKATVNSIHRSTRQYIELPVKKVELHEGFNLRETTTTVSFERVYRRPFWAADPKKASEKDYRALFKELTGESSEDYFAYKLFAVDDILGFTALTALFYIPLKSPTNKLTPRRIQLYVSEELKLDSCKKLLPGYLSFITGLVNSEDLPHPIYSWKCIKESMAFKALRKHLVKQCLEMFMGLAEDEQVFSTFYAEYGHYIKLGVCSDYPNRSKLIELLRYHSTRSSAKYVSLKDYISNLKKSQKEIYYTSEDPKHLAKSSLQKFVQLGYEVLFMTDAIDKVVFEVLKEYEGKTLVQVS